ncbi:MAG: hypothetical protein V2A74_08260 [bacterium]
MRQRIVIACMLNCLLIVTAMSRAAEPDVFAQVPLDRLQVTEGNAPDVYQTQMAAYFWMGTPVALQPYAVLDGKGEAYPATMAVDTTTSPTMPRFSVTERIGLAFRIPQGEPLRGRLFWPKPDRSGMTVSKFTIPAANVSSTPAARKEFFAAKAEHFDRLASSGIAGAAWFRHQATLARAEVGDQKKSEEQLRREEMMRMMRGRGETEDFDEELYSLFSGGRAVTENLQLGRTLMVNAETSLTVPLESLPGITVRPMDWKKLTAGLQPKADTLAGCIPADQHAVFFPTFQAMITLMDEADLSGTPIARLAEPRSEDAHTRERYERQLCLATDVLGRMMGPSAIKSVAFTGSDPYLRSGSDVAVLFEAVDAQALQTLLAARRTAALAANPGAKPVKGDVAGVAWQGAVSPDRAVCSYMAAVGKTVIVTNSLAQLDSLVQAAQGKTPSLDKTDEYIFFRDRYKQGEDGETALFILSDATIRRWCGPGWRIGESRRMRAQAVLAELQARNLDQLARKEKPSPEKIPGAGDIAWLPDGPQSSIYGTLSFLTPVSELAMDKVTPSEANAYRWFADGYQRNWTRYFDPIAVRVLINQGQISSDLTIMPLIAESDLREFISVTQGAEIKPAAGDPHPEALLHLLVAINKESEPIQSLGNQMSMMSAAPSQMGQTGAQLTNPLGWLGSSAALYVDADPLWDELANTTDTQTLMEKNLSRLPIALHFEVSDGLKLAVFLATLRTLIEGSSPGLTHWSTEQYKNQPYAKITVDEPFGRTNDETTASQKLAIYYVSTPRALIVTVSEAVLKRAIDRMTASKPAAGAPPAATEPAWQGKHLAFRGREKLVSLLRVVGARDYRQAMQQRAWNNIPILNEWHRLYPSESPVAFHERFWQARLTGPDGSDYVWNEKWQTMESASYGHPAAPKLGPSNLPVLVEQATMLDAGVTFENDGLRGRVSITRAPATK